MRHLLIAALLTASVQGQLATNYDGSDLLLAVNWKLRRGPETQGPATVYRLRDGQWSAIVEASGNVAYPALSSDSRVVAWERHFPCFGSCMLAVPRSTSEAQGLRQELKINKYIVFYSPNGRFAVTPGFLGMSPWEMQDLETGYVWTSASVPLTKVQGVSDNGTLIGAHDGRVAVWRPGGEIVHLMPASDQMSLQISADSSAAVVEIGTIQSDRTLWRIDIESGTRRVIAEWAAPSVQTVVYFNPISRGISHDGKRVTFFQTPHLKIYEHGEVRSLAEVAEGLWHMTISGSGRVVYALTSSGRLLKIDTETSQTTELIAGLPLQASQVYGGSVPGSVLQLRSVGSFAGLRFHVDGQEFPVVDASEHGRGFVQIPWEFIAPERGRYYDLVMEREGSPFEFRTNVFIVSAPSAQLSIRETSAQFPEMKAVLPDWSGLVTAETPAIPGTTVHSYMLGLGPLDRPVRTGEPGPADPPARPLTPIACYIRGVDDNPMPRGLELPFVAYAPGLVGVYQVDLTIPPDWPAGRSIINCEGAGYTGAWIYVGARLTSN